MLSELQRRKLERRFALFDVSENGVLDKDDFELAAQRVARAFRRVPGMRGYRGIRSSHLQQWQHLQAAMDADGDGNITKDEYIAAMTSKVIEDPTGYDQVIRPSIEAMLDIADVNHDNQLDPEEFVRMLGAYSVPAEDAAAVFARLDRDDSGYLTRDEIDLAFEEFFLSDDADAPGNWLFGAFS